MKEKIITADGSFSYYDSTINECYHSKNGAYSESTHVYINNGLNYWFEKNKKKICRIFELGYGTGLNALLAKRYAEKNKLKVFYHTIDKFPLTADQIEVIKPRKLSTSDNFIYSAGWDSEFSLTSFFSIHKIHADFFIYQFDNTYDVFFYDAFAFHAQPQIWEKNILKKSIDVLNNNGVWVTYCSKGIVRRAVESFDVKVEKIPGFSRKREMLRALKK